MLECFALRRSIGWYKTSLDGTAMADVGEMPSTHYGGCSFSRSKPRPREGVKLSNSMDVKAMLVARVQRGRKRLGEVLTSLVDKVEFAVLRTLIR